MLAALYPEPLRTHARKQSAQAFGASLRTVLAWIHSSGKCIPEARRSSRANLCSGERRRIVRGPARTDSSRFVASPWKDCRQTPQPGRAKKCPGLRRSTKPLCIYSALFEKYPSERVDSRHRATPLALIRTGYADHSKGTPNHRAATCATMPTSGTPSVAQATTPSGLTSKADRPSRCAVSPAM